MTGPDEGRGIPDDCERGDLADLEDLGQRLRVALAQEARDVVPSDRLDDIRDRVRDDRRPGRPPWLLPLAAAAAVAVITVAAWLGLRPAGVTLPVAGNTSSTAPSAVGPTPSTVPTTSTDPTATATATVPTTPRALPVYFVEQVGPDRWGLVREFTTQPVPVGADAAALGAASVNLSVQGAPRNATTTVLDPWQPGTTSTVTTDGPEIVVVLSQSGRAGLGADQQKIAIQQVVWAVTAGVQQNRPVAISVRAGGPVFAGVPTGPFTRPSTD